MSVHPLFPPAGKFRAVKTTNAKIAAVLAVPGAEQVLLAVGFERREAEVPGCEGSS